MCVTVASHLSSWFLHSNHSPNHVIAKTRTHSTVFAKRLVLECQNKYVIFLKVHSNNVTAQNMTNRISCPLQSISLPTISTTMITEPEEEARWLFCGLLIACVTLTEHFLISLFALIGDSSFFLKIMLIVSSIIQH